MLGSRLSLFKNYTSTMAFVRGINSSRGAMISLKSHPDGVLEMDRRIGAALRTTQALVLLQLGQDPRG